MQVPKGRTNSIYAYYGGKNKLTKDIVAMIPDDHKIFVEMCAGSGVLTLNKPKSKIEVLNDIDPIVYNFFSIMKDPKQSKELHKFMRFTPFNFTVFDIISEKIKNDEIDDPLEKAQFFLASIAQSFTGKATGAWAGKSGKPKRSAKYKSMVKHIPDYHNRIKNVEIRNKDIFDIVSEFNTKQTVIYCDPPYLPSLRVAGSRKEYRYEMPKVKHVRLIRILNNKLYEPQYKGKFIIAGYDKPEDTEKMYMSSMRYKYRTEVMVTKDGGTIEKGGSRKKEKECMWFNFPLDEYAINWLTKKKSGVRQHDYFGPNSTPIVVDGQP